VTESLFRFTADYRWRTAAVAAAASPSPFIASLTCDGALCESKPVDKKSSCR